MSVVRTERTVMGGGTSHVKVAYPANSVEAARAGSNALWRVLLGCALMYLVLQGGLMLLIPSLDQPSAALVVAAAMFVVAIVIERGFFARDVASGLKALGLGRPTGGAMLVSLILIIGMGAFFPIYSAVTEVPIGLRADWLWVLIGAVALNGLAEETLFRGFVFGHLRQGGHSFWRAGFTSLVIFGLVHLFLLVGNPPEIAILGALVAAVAAFPFAFLYERAGNTIWAGAVLHVGAHFFRLVEIPETEYMTVAMTWLVVQVGFPFLVLAFINTLLRSEPRTVASPAARA
jgi:membrane protease YdiL (CAAX protease family)